MIRPAVKPHNAASLSNKHLDEVYIYINAKIRKLDGTVEFICDCNTGHKKVQKLGSCKAGKL